MNPTDRATEMFAHARLEGQAAHRMLPGEDPAGMRGEVRRPACADGGAIRTGMWGDIVVVVTEDAAIWGDTTALMRKKPTPPD